MPPPEAWREAHNHAARYAEAGAFSLVPLDHAYIDRSLVESLALVVQRQPDRTAIVEATRTLTYRQFWNLVARFGHAVANATAPRGPIALLLRDYAGCAGGLFAGIIAGRPCLALDCAHPPERNAEFIRSANAAMVVIQAGDEEALAAADGRQVLAMDDPGTVEEPAPLSLPSRLGLDEPAFILPTSGSTGQPKLVVHSQRTEAYRANRRGDAASLTEDDRIMLCAGPPTSYSGIGFLLAPLRAGATAHLINMRQEGISGLLHRVANERITVLLAGTSLLRSVLELAEARKAVSHLRLVRAGGEATVHSDIALLRSVLPAGCLLETGDGATESTNLRWPIPLHDTRDPVRVPGGYPELGGDFLILDDDGTACLPGVPGELIVRSRYNALGEWQDGRCVPGRLIPDPTGPDQRIYFTVDIARQTVDGIYIILGRKDRQVKINGQRVEPMEIEAAIREAPGVLDAIVLPRTGRQTTTLLAFVAVGPNVDPDLGVSLRQMLRSRLPNHMVPSRIDVMGELPRLPGGKVDAMALLARSGG